MKNVWVDTMLIWEHLKQEIIHISACDRGRDFKLQNQRKVKKSLS